MGVSLNVSSTAQKVGVVQSDSLLLPTVRYRLFLRTYTLHLHVSGSLEMHTDTFVAESNSNSASIWKFDTDTSYKLQLGMDSASLHQNSGASAYRQFKSLTAESARHHSSYGWNDVCTVATNINLSTANSNNSPVPSRPQKSNP